MKCCTQQPKENEWIQWKGFTSTKKHTQIIKYEGFNFNSGNYLFTIDTK